MKKKEYENFQLTLMFFGTMVDIVEEARVKTEERYDNLSERSQESEKGEMLEQEIENLTEAHSLLEEAYSYLLEIEEE